MKILKVVVAIFALAVVAFLVVAAFLPKTYTVTRSASIEAPPVIVFAQVNDLKLWKDWSPWAAMDPSMKTWFGDTHVGEGASYSWKGDQVGEGELTITHSDMPSSIRTHVTFDGQSEGNGEWSFEPENDGTLATWTMNGNLPWPTARYFGLIIDDMLGPQFEDGLQRLKTKAEADAQGLGGLGKVLGQGMQELGKELGKAMEEAGVDFGKAMEEAMKAPQ